MNRHRLILYSVLASITALSGCSGGGGGGGVVRGGPMMSEMPEMPECRTGNHCIDPAESAEYLQQRAPIAQAHRAQSSFTNQWGLAAVNVDQAWANLQLARGENVAPGADVTVGIIDTGIDKGHTLFAQTTIEETFIRPAVDEDGGRFSHGTAVASIIAARPAGRNVHEFQGVAWGADLKMFAIPLGSPPPPGTPYRPLSLSIPGDRNRDIAFASLYRGVLSEGMDVLNLSFGTSGLTEYYTQQVINNNFSLTIAALAQEGDQDKTILVWSAGNSHGRFCTLPNEETCVSEKLNARSPSFYSGLPAHFEELRGHSIAVAAVDRNGDIASFSNRCGIAADWCISAPGAGMNVAFFGPHPSTGAAGARGVRTGAGGTSYAAPMVSGGLALMKQLFRGQLSSEALVSRLYATANKSGKYEDRAIYGQGLIDLGAATSPVGLTSVALGNTVAGAGAGIRMTNLRLGGALGDGLERSLAGREVAAFDSLGAPFWFKLANFTGTTGGPSSLMQLHELAAQTPITRIMPGQSPGHSITFIPDQASGAIEHDLGYARLRFGLREMPAGARDGHFALADNATTLTLTGHNGMTLTAFTAPGITGQSPTSGAALSWRPFNVPIGFRAGWLAEQDTLLGTTATGAFGQLAANAMMTGLETGFEIGRWQLAADAELGTARPQLQGGMLARMSALTTSAFALNATRHLATGGSIRFSLSQPLRVEHGQASLSVPIGRTHDGHVLRAPLTADLTPSGRQLDLSARWSHPLANNGHLRLDATWTHHPGHIAQAPPATRLLAAWQFTF